MYQVLMFAMNLALVANNIGLMWVAIELATLTTVLMVGIYRTHEALEAAWKYFILGSVGIALALFGTILIYMAARPVVGEGLDAMVWTVLVARAAPSIRRCSNVAFVFLLLGYGTKVGLAPLHAWLPDAHAEGPTPISAVLSGLLLNVALYALLRFQDAAGGQCRRARARAADGDARPAVAGVRGVHALPPARHQAAVRLFVDRAHGHHRVRLRHGRPARQFRRPVAHDHAFS
jgi:NADH:ubiquinone oxidoreductase subunit 2 (subunit N)